MEPAVRSLLYVVPDVGPEHLLEVPPSVDQDVVEALSARSPHEPLREGVRSGRPDRRAYHPHSIGSEHLIEAPWELRVSVAQEEPNARKPLVHRQVPGLLGD